MQYACRKTLADSRPRIRGRFAKNDEFGEAARPTSNQHEFDDEEEVSFIIISFLQCIIYADCPGILGLQCRNQPLRATYKLEKKKLASI